MIGQSKISSFFTSNAVKRKASTNSEFQDPKEKLLKSSDSCTNRDSASEKNDVSITPTKSASEPSGLALTPEQHERMEANRKLAEARLQEKEKSDFSGLVVNMGSTWRSALSAEFTRPYFKELTSFVSAERRKGKVFPPPDQVFTWTQMCKINEVKVVILGQDPYHGPGQAHGLCFSVRQGITPPPSLENMFKELKTDVEGFKHPGHGTLTGWAKQGVLLLNACLTVRAHQANSHAGKGWEKLTDATITWLNRNSSGIVFMLWGAYAQKKGAHIDQKKHHVLKAVHPSPLSAHRGFFGCGHFSKCNSFLEKAGKKPIDWTCLPPE